MLGCNRGASVRHWLTLVTGLVECLCFAGAVFGWASLAFVLKSEGYFSSMCVNGTEVNGTQVLDCSGQDEQLSLVFTIASFMNNFMTLPSGFLFDFLGTTINLHCRCPVRGLLKFRWATCLVPTAPQSSPFYNGAFDSSSALFLIFKASTRMTRGTLMFESGISLMVSFISLAACSAAPLLRTFLLLPKDKIPYPLPDSYTYGVPCGRCRTFSPAPSSEAAPPQPPQKSFRECVFSWLFLWQVVWLSVMQLRHYMFIGTLNPMLQRLAEGDPALVSQYTNAFAFTQLCGVLCAPWNGLIMDRHKGKPRAAGANSNSSNYTQDFY
ncbi:hypothetical protein CRUP_009866 [Coryphaenoides rupestris]|nr:hypothetical protein CRUP_009866 [Coryphaenoides rupestris]